MEQTIHRIGERVEAARDDVLTAGEVLRAEVVAMVKWYNTR